MNDNVNDKMKAIEPRDWVDIAPEYRRRWQQGHPHEAESWNDYESWYRYGYEMAYDPRFEGRQWADVEGDLRTQYPEWLDRQGYTYDRDESAWDRFKNSVKDAWDWVTGQRR